MKHEKKIDQLLGSSNSQLGNIIAKAAQLRKLETILLSHLPKEMRGHCQVANYRNGCLVIFLSNAAWATKFRYLSSDLLDTLRQEKQLPGLANIQCRVRPS